MALGGWGSVGCGLGVVCSVGKVVGVLVGVWGVGWGVVFGGVCSGRIVDGCVLIA